MASIQKSVAPEMLLALMDEAYTGSPIGDGGTSLDLSCNGCCFAGCNNSPQSDRLKEALKIAPRLLDSYLASAVHDANDCFICALILQLMARYSLFPDKMFSLMFKMSFALYEATRVHLQVQRRLVEFMVAAFHRSPHSIALLKKPVVNRLGEAYDNPAKTQLALQLCWAIGEHGGGGGAHKDAARELFESLEFLLYENFSSRFLAHEFLMQGCGNACKIL